MMPDLFTTVCLTRVGRRGSVRYTTNNGAIEIVRDLHGKWAVGPTGEHPFKDDLDSLAAAVDFVLDAREMMRPA